GGVGVGGGRWGEERGEWEGGGVLDRAVANPTDGTVSIYLGLGDGTFQAPVSYSVPGEPASLVAGDFNRDGRLDLAVADRAGNDIAILLGLGDGTFRTAGTFEVGDGA